MPNVGDVVRDITTRGRYVVTNMATADIIKTDWLSGAAVPGNRLMRERAIFRGSISGTILTVTAIDQGAIANGQTVVGMFANSGVSAGTTISSQSSGTPGGVGVYVVNNSQTVAATQLVAGNPALANIQGGGVVNTETSVAPLTFDLAGGMYFNAPFYFARTRTPYFANNAASTATMTNAPVAGNPTKWVAVDDNGTRRYIPMWGRSGARSLPSGVAGARNVDWLGFDAHDIPRSDCRFAFFPTIRRFSSRNGCLWPGHRPVRASKRGNDRVGCLHACRVGDDSFCGAEQNFS